MLNSLKCFVLGTPAPTSALTPAEQVLSVVEQGQIDRASRLAAEEQARLDAERQAKLDELSDIEAEIAAALAQKTELYARIKTTLAALVPDLAALDALEISGMAMNAKACTLQHETRSPLTSAWRDAKLPGVGRVVRNWLQRLEGSRMPVYHSMQWLATRWTGVNQSVEHFDLVRLPDGAGGYRYGIFSQPEGEGIWKEELSEGEALARLQTWVDEERSAAGRPHSQVTPAGRKWLASVT